MAYLRIQLNHTIPRSCSDIKQIFEQLQRNRFGSTFVQLKPIFSKVSQSLETLFFHIYGLIWKRQMIEHPNSQNRTKKCIPTRVFFSFFFIQGWKYLISCLMDEQKNCFTFEQFMRLENEATKQLHRIVFRTVHNFNSTRFQSVTPERIFSSR